MKYSIFIFFLLKLILASSQTNLDGFVLDKEGTPISQVNVYIEGTYDGGSTDDEGYYSFNTESKGAQLLVLSSLGYETLKVDINVSEVQQRKDYLDVAVNSLTGVTLSAGTFEAGGESKASVLKPLDIVTTAGAMGDFVAALQTLPGTTTVNEDGRLFVRGGDANETQIFIDGLRVFQPFIETANNSPTRGRFSPFLFKGISFSTGGYSAEYGQALSSVLILNTEDVAEQEKTDISLMSVGGGLGHTEIWNKQSLSINTSYINLAPYEALLPSDQNVEWIKPYESLSGEAVYRFKLNKGLLKFYTAFNYSNLSLRQENVNFEEFVPYQLKNNNYYLNTSYKHFFGKGWSLRGGVSYAYDKNAIGILDDDIDTQEADVHIKVKGKKAFSNRFSLYLGMERFIIDYKDVFKPLENTALSSEFKEQLSSVFTEVDWFFSDKLALKAGLRLEHSRALSQQTLAPRISLAYRPGPRSQFSLALGNFYQNPDINILKYDTSLIASNTWHYILNYQYTLKGRTLRAEAYYKDYNKLVKYNTEEPVFFSDFTNTGSGYATGIDLFWRDNATINNLEYWLSYSFLNTKRDYQNFTELATPNFAPKHSFSAVTKYWVTDLRSQMGLSYTFGSGRPYDNPNNPQFLNEKTKAYNNISFNWAYLIDQQKILYFSVSNVFGFNNISNYEYANAPNPDGSFNRLAIRPPADSFFFVGFFWTISSDKKSNQLQNL